MADYKIVGYSPQQVLLEFDGIRRNFPLPMTDGLYPEGDALTALLDRYVANAREAVAAQKVEGTNAATIQAMVVPVTLTNEQFNADVDRQILIIERKQARALRELALGDATATARLQTLNDQIAALRATRK